VTSNTEKSAAPVHGHAASRAEYATETDDIAEKEKGEAGRESKAAKNLI
jgi:hypothetical protein